MKKNTNSDLEKSKASAPQTNNAPSSSNTFHEANSSVANEKKFENVVNTLVDVELAEQSGTNIDDELALTIFQKCKDVSSDKKESAVSTGSIFFGILSKCFLDNCEVHIIDEKSMVHFKDNESIPEQYIKARDWYRQNAQGSDVMILVFSDHLEVISADGKSRSV